MDTTIKNLSAIEILDSRGNPTLEVEITLKNGTIERVGVPSGASTGIHEAVELRDNDAARYNGKGVLKAVNHINKTIADLIIGMNALNQTEIDLAMIHLDGTTNKSQLGANAIVGVSLAVCKAAATAKQLALFQYLGGINATRLPCPMFNVLNGGIHANWQGADIQEFMICPVGAPNFAEALRWASETYHHLKDVLKENNYSVGIGDEGGFAPALTSNSQALELIVIAIEKAGYQAGRDIAIAIDPASSGFYDEKTQLYYLKSESKYLSSVEMIDMYAGWVNQYPLILLEDGLAEDDWTGWALLNNKLGDKIELVGDDIFVTNVTRLARGIKENIANSVCYSFVQNIEKNSNL